MAEYLVLIYEDEGRWADVDKETERQFLESHVEFIGRHQASIRGGSRLESSEKVRSLRRDDSGNVSITDGPFAETKEAVGGYYLFEADDLEGALAIASEVPVLFGRVELHPLDKVDRTPPYDA